MYYWNIRTRETVWSPPGTSMSSTAEAGSPVSGGLGGFAGAGAAGLAAGMGGCGPLHDYVRPQTGWQFIAHHQGRAVPSRCAETTGGRPVMTAGCNSAWVE